MKKHIPNTITLFNLFSGCIAITMAFQGNLQAVAIWVAIAAFFDFLDGTAARLLNAYSALGKELDSLSDVVSFGVAPAAAVFMLLRDHTLMPGFLEPVSLYIPYLAFIIPVFSALRLAKFNLDERQKATFLGLPVPANALFWVSYCFGLQNRTQTNEYLFYLTIAILLITSWLLISEIPMFSLKIKRMRLKGNESVVLLVILMITFMVLWGIMGIAWGIVAYMILSLLTHRKGNGTVK